jgi:hypothetical protein
MTNVRVSIGRLGLDGFSLSPGDARVVRRSVESELGRLLSENDLPPRLAESGARPRLSRRPLELGAWRDPRDLGTQVAHTLFTGFGGSKT